MNILITGYDGYIGTVLSNMLLNEGYDITGLDTGFYKDGTLFKNRQGNFKYITKDIRNLSIDDLNGYQAVIHLAELSNDPTSQLFPKITYDINHKASVRLASLAKESGVSRFVYTSSCSVYGIANADFVDEKSQVNPQTAYARCKVRVEEDVQKMADDNFSPTFLRNATAFGASPRMRFDLVVNNLCGWAWTMNKINVTSDGTPWRPLVHILDISRAILNVLCAPKELIHNEIFNVGDTSSNYQVRDIAETVAAKFKGSDITFGTLDGDNRSYRVSFDKINNILNGFNCAWDLKKGVDQLYDVFKQIGLTKDIFTFRSFTRLEQLKYLISERLVDKELYWINY